MRKLNIFNINKMNLKEFDMNINNDTNNKFLELYKRDCINRISLLTKNIILMKNMM